MGIFSKYSKHTNLGNRIARIFLPERNSPMKKDRIKQRVKLPSGEVIWCTGDSIGDVVTNLLSKVSVQPSIKMAAPTLYEYGEKWYSLYHAPKVKWNTAQNTRIYLDKHIYPRLGSKPINDITYDDIQALFNGMRDYARSTVEKVQITLNQIMKNAMEDGLVDRNVMASSRYVISKKVKTREPLSMSEAFDVESNLDALPERERLMVAIAMHTGLRRGEILGLSWGDIDLENRILHVRRSVTFNNNQPAIGPTKSKAGVRDVPIDYGLHVMLSRCCDKTGFVIKNTRTPNTPMTERTYRRAWERIGKQIDLHGATAHVFRHTYATMAEPHTDPKTLQTVLGHADIKTTMNRYTHAIPEQIQKLSDLDLFCDTPVTLGAQKSE